MSNLPIVSWFVKKKSASNFTHTVDYYLGNINGNTDTEVCIRIWNNYQGIKNVSDIKNAKLIINASTIDDSYIFDYLDVVVDGVKKKIVSYSDTKKCINLEKTLSGEKNNGSDDNSSNYIDVNLIFKSLDYRVKENIKNLLFDIVAGE